MSAAIKHLPFASGRRRKWLPEIRRRILLPVARIFARLRKDGARLRVIVGFEMDSRQVNNARLKDMSENKQAER